MANDKSGDITFQVTNFQSGATAVGAGAHAVYNQTIENASADEIVACVQATINALRPLPMDAAARTQVESGLQETIAAAQRQNLPAARSALERVGTVLKHAGVTLKNAVELAAPLGKLAQMLGVGPHIFG